MIHTLPYPLVTGGDYDIDGNVITEPTTLAGFHVNALEEIQGADEYLVTPSSPICKFAGRDDALFYVFPEEETFREFVPEEINEDLL